MKFLVILNFILFSTFIYSETKRAIVKKEVKENKERKVPGTSSEAPCDTKEDVLKKLEEEKKKQKPFSFHNNDTGCSVDKK